MKIKLLTFVITFFSVVMFSLPVSANTQLLGTCFTDSLTGKERKLLAKWIFFAMAVHPELKPFSNIETDRRLNIDKLVGELITRLLVEDCAAEAKAAQKTDSLALQKAFEFVGKVAMQELMTNQDVIMAMNNVANYADQSKINSLFVE